MWVEDLINWFFNNGRKFYWRMNELNDFQWLILEILLRRSKAEKVNLICYSFFSKYKSPDDINARPEAELSNDIRSLGYHLQRCKILKEVSKEIIERFNYNIPEICEDLCSIKHIGFYISNAYLCFHLNRVC
jgi:adenine-specific DNA glycosylase